MENKYGLYIAHEGTVVRLPVNPESYSITQDNDNGNYNVLGVGPIMIPGRRSSRRPPGPASCRAGTIWARS